MEQTQLRTKTTQIGRLTVTDVRYLPGDSGFLLDDGQTAVLYDTGFAFSCAGVIRNIRHVLGNRKLDHILLTHSHYDHALGVPELLEAYPEAKVVAGAYAAGIFARDSAKATMLDLDRKAAKIHGMRPGNPMLSRLRVDIPVKDGDTVRCGSLTFTAVELPGHTKCSVGYYLAEEKLLLSTETLGVYLGNDLYLPGFLVGYQMTLDAFDKVRRLGPETMLLPHYGAVTGELTAAVLENGEAVVRETARTVLTMYGSGKTKEEILAFLTQRDYSDAVKPVYPVDAFCMNTRIMIDRTLRELACLR